MKKVLKFTLSELKELKTRIQTKGLTSSDLDVFEFFVDKTIAQLSQTENRKLQKLLEEIARIEKEGDIIDVDFSSKEDESNPQNETDNSDKDKNSEGGANKETPEGTDNGKPPKKKNHGRLGAKAFSKAKEILHQLKDGIIGKLCKSCHAGPMRKHVNKTVIRVLSQPIFQVELHIIEQAHCKLCGFIERANTPSDLMEGVGTSYIVYSWKACAMLAYLHYYHDLPFNRIDFMQKGWGLPFPDSNQWRVVDDTDKLLVYLFNALEKFAIQNANNLKIDDTNSNVLSLASEIKNEIEECKKNGKNPNSVRSGINATSVYIDTDSGSIVLYYTGRHHAGEILEQLLKFRRDNPEKLIKVSDAASKNFDHSHGDIVDDAVCNAHAFLKFHDVKDIYPDEYAIAARIYNAVFENEEFTKSQKMSRAERLEYHKKHSKPLMHELKDMCEQKIKEKLVEMNSKLWGPITFIINQWKRLILFCEKEGVPLDTNLVEQSLIIPVRYIAASFFYRNENGAEVGDRFMSLIETAKRQEIEPVGYLEYCLENHEDLRRNPEKYFPWSYKNMLINKNDPPGTSPPTKDVKTTHHVDV